MTSFPQAPVLVQFEGECGFPVSGRAVEEEIWQVGAAARRGEFAGFPGNACASGKSEIRSQRVRTEGLEWLRKESNPGLFRSELPKWGTQFHPS